ALPPLSPLFSRCVPHRHLPSSPTRPSSDLDTGGAPPARRPAARGPLAARAPCRTPEPRAPATQCLAGALTAAFTPTVSAPAKHRSEEHTSELQSRGHLVCRLLLEQKKKKKR